MSRQSPLWRSTSQCRTQPGVRLSDGALLGRTVPGHDYSAFTDTGDIIAVANETAHRLDADSLEVLSTLPRTEGGSRALMVSRDGATLLNVGSENRLRLYDLALDIPLGDALDADTAWGVLGGFLSVDGDVLFANTLAGVVKWDLRPDAQARAACTLAGRELSAEEWATYFPGEAQVDTCAALAPGRS